LHSGDYPKWARWFGDEHGNPVDWLTHSVGKMVAGEDNPATSEAVKTRLDQLREELEGPNASPIERLLAERAAFCWFYVNIYEFA
jgi:hypothetical protein